MFGYFTKKRITTPNDGAFTMPKVYGAVSLGQYVRWHMAKDSVNKCAAALNEDIQSIRKLTPDSVSRINAAFQRVIESETTIHVKAFRLNGKEYGFFPAIDEMQLGQYIDLDELSKAVFVNKDYDKLIDMMCVCFRPITLRFGDNYEVAKYTGNESRTNRKDIEQLPMSVVNGALLFFSNFELELLKSSLDYLTTTMQELQTA